MLWTVTATLMSRPSSSLSTRGDQRPQPVLEVVLGELVRRREQGGVLDQPERAGQARSTPSAADGSTDRRSGSGPCCHTATSSALSSTGRVHSSFACVSRCRSRSGAAWLSPTPVGRPGDRSHAGAGSPKSTDLSTDCVRRDLAADVARPVRIPRHPPSGGTVQERNSVPEWTDNRDRRVACGSRGSGRPTRHRSPCVWFDLGHAPIRTVTRSGTRRVMRCARTG